MIAKIEEKTMSYKKMWNELYADTNAVKDNTSDPYRKSAYNAVIEEMERKQENHLSARISRKLKSLVGLNKQNKEKS